MSNIVRFVGVLIWFAIGLSMVGTLRQCTAVLAGKASKSRQEDFSFGHWSRKLIGQRAVR
jgi:hypothetical protein